MHSIKVTYPLCKFGFDYAFKKRDKNISEWRSVQNMHSFNANVVTILWEEKVQTIKYVCMYVCMFVCIYVCMFVCIYVCMYLCMYLFMYMYLCMYVFMYVCL
jgi:hypothetical protein